MYHGFWKTKKNPDRPDFQILSLLMKTIINLFLFRSFWAVAVFGMIGIATWMITENFLKFFSYPIETKVTLKNAPDLEFPAITLCNLNKFR